MVVVGKKGKFFLDNVLPAPVHNIYIFLILLLTGEQERVVNCTYL